jgi:hypothetical protein
MTYSFSFRHVQFNDRRMSLPAKHKRLHKALACMLYDGRYHGRFISMDTAAELVHSIEPEGRAGAAVEKDGRDKAVGGRMRFGAAESYAERDVDKRNMVG